MIDEFSEILLVCPLVICTHSHLYQLKLPIHSKIDLEDLMGKTYFHQFCRMLLMIPHLSPLLYLVLAISHWHLALELISLFVLNFILATAIEAT